ncbi:hypothetical protein [Sphaerotilus hippei]|nr:hypothetical protein [Sphaerotilus hippei]
MAHALKPLTGMSPAQLEAYQRRMSKPASLQRECRRLEGEVVALKGEERSGRGDRAQIGMRLQDAQQKLLYLRC